MNCPSRNRKNLNIYENQFKLVQNQNERAKDEDTKQRSTEFFL
jgi:hypothetical protein